MIPRRSLKRQLNLVLLLVAVLVFVVAGSLAAFWQYDKIMSETREVMGTQAAIVKKFIGARLAIGNQFFARLGKELQGKKAQEIVAQLRLRLYPSLSGNIVYVLDHNNQVVMINPELQQFIGFDLSHMPYRQKERPVSEAYQSVFSSRSVVALCYPLPGGLLLVIERDVLSIFSDLDIFSNEFSRIHQITFFVMDQGGRATFHPQPELIRSRHNLDFDLHKRPRNRYGLVPVIYQQQGYYLSHEKLEIPADWQLVLLLSAKHLRQELIQTVLFQLLTLLALCLTLVSALRFFLNRFFNRPVVEMVSQLSQYRPDAAAGDVVSVQAVAEIAEFQDIAEAVNRMALSVNQSRRQLAGILDSMEALVYVADMQTYEILFINDYGCRIWGDVRGRICWQAIQDGQNGPCAFCTNDRLLDGDGQATGVYAWEFQNTVTQKCYDCRDQAIPWTDGRMVRLEIATDISERKEMEAEMRSNETRFRTIFEQAAVGVAEIDSKTGRFLQINRRYCDLLGYSRAEMMNLNFMNITHPDDLQTDLDNIDLLLKGGQREFSLEKRCFCKDGTVIWVSLFVSPMWQVGEDPSTQIAIVEDITARKQAEHILERENLSLEKLVQERTRALEEKNKELEKLNNYYVDRELENKKLKMIIARLKKS